MMRRKRLNDVTLAQFAILSRAGGTAQWGRNIRVVMVGAAEADGDVLARQVLTCALYGTVRNTDWESALSSLRGKRADVVMGLAVPGQKNMEKAFKKVKELELLSMPESLVSIQLPDDSMEKAKVVFGGQNAESYALYGGRRSAPRTRTRMSAAVCFRRRRKRVLWTAQP